MANQMVTFPSFMAFPEPGQIFMVGSMTWVIGPDGCREIMEAVQDHPTPIVPISAMTYPISAPRRWVRRSISNDNLITYIDRVTNRLAECQLLVDSVLDQSREAMNSLHSKITKPLQPGYLLGHIVRGGQILI